MFDEIIAMIIRIIAEECEMTEEQSKELLRKIIEEIED